MSGNGIDSPDRRIARILENPWVQVGALLLLAAFLRFHRLSEESVWGDELVSLRRLSAPTLLDFLRQLRLDDPPMFPGYFCIQYLVAKMLSPLPDILRSLSILFGLATLVCAYRLTRRLFGTFAAALSGLCLACSVQQINYAQEIRMYALTSLLAVASVWAMFLAMERKTTRYEILWFAINAVLLSTHLLAVMLVGIEGLFLLTFKYGRKRFPFFLVVHLLFAIPWCAWVRTIDFHALAGAARWIAVPDLAFLSAVIGSLADYYTNPLRFYSPPVSLLKAIVCFAIFVSAAGFAAKAAADARRPAIPRPEANPALFMLMWFILPPAALLAASYLYEPCLINRYILYCSYSLFIMAGAGIAAIPFHAPKWIIAAALVVSLAILAPLQKPLRVNWLAATKEVCLRAKPTDALITPKYGECPLLRYYLPALARNIQFCDRKDLEKELSRRAAQGNGVFVFLTGIRVYATEQELAKQNLHYEKMDFEGPPLLLLHIPDKHKEAPANTLYDKGG